MTPDSQQWQAAPQATPQRAPALELLREYHSLAGGVAEVLDDLDHLLGEAADTEASRLALLRRKLSQVLLYHGIRPIAREGQELDLRFHEVVGTEARNDVAADTILSIIKPGYEVMVPGLQPMLLRCAKVIVSAAPEPDEGAAPAAEPPQEEPEE